MQGRSDLERQQWARWVLGSHSDQFLPEMTAAVEQLNRQDPIEQGQPVLNPGATFNDLVAIATQRGCHCVVFDQPLQCQLFCSIGPRALSQTVTPKALM